MPAGSIELATTDKPASAQFYTDLFGWSMETFQPMDYTMTAFPEGDTTLAFSPPNDKGQSTLTSISEEWRWTIYH